MKVAVLSESPADEAAVRILVEALLGEATQPTRAHPRLGPRSWPMVANVLPAVLKHLHYHTDADALVVVADSNHSPVHPPGKEPKDPGKQSRLARLRGIAAVTLKHVTPVPGRAAVKWAIGLAVPAVEAWYLCGREQGVSENAWRQGLQSGTDPYAKNGLKQTVYGTDRPGLPLETRRAAEEATRVAADLELLERKFPIGFGALAGDVRGWR